MVTITSREVPYTLRDVGAFLMIFDTCLEKNSIVNTNGSLPFMNLAVSSNQSSGNGARFNNKNNFSQLLNNNYCGKGRGRGSGKNYNNNNRPQCQFCGKMDHTMLHCYNRFDSSF